MASAPSPQSNDRLHRVQRPERKVVSKYRDLCAALVDIAENEPNAAIRVSAHRVIQEYIIKPLKQQYMEERKARAESKDSTPKSVNIAVSNLPVGAAAQVQIVNTGQQAQTQHNGPSRKEINTHQLPSISHKTNDDSPLSQLGVGGEAAEKPGAALTNVDSPPDFLDISNELSHTSPETVAQRILECFRESSQVRQAFESASGWRLMTGRDCEDLLTSVIRSPRSSEPPSSGSSEVVVKTYETAHDERSPTVRRCPDCAALWRTKQAEKVALGRRCLQCGTDIGGRHPKAVRCFRCSKARKNQQTVDWQVERKKKEVERSKGDGDGLQ